MFRRLQQNKRIQPFIALAAGLVFGIFLEKSGVAYYDVILGQLLLRDFTVLKVMLSAVLVGMVGVHVIVGLKQADFHIKPFLLGGTVPGAALFGIGFALLGYCPGTIIAGTGHGALDAGLVGIPGILLGSAAYAWSFPWLREKFLKRGYLGPVRLPEVLKLPEWLVVVLVGLVILVLLFSLERAGL